MTLTVASWNVNSLRVRLPQVLDWLAGSRPDILGLQETKLVDDKFPVEELANAGYQCAFAGQPTYNGVAVLAREAPRDVVRDLPGIEDSQRRVLGATVGDTRVLNLYVPNGQAVGTDKYQYKLNWMERLAEYVRQQEKEHSRLVVVGDFNVAPDARDVHDPAEWEGKVLFSGPEREALQELISAGLTDTFRLFDQPEKTFSWWDYRAAAFRRNRGLRIDHILASKPLADTCIRSEVDIEPRRWQRPSDHAPVVAEFDA